MNHTRGDVAFGLYSAHMTTARGRSTYAVVLGVGAYLIAAACGLFTGGALFFLIAGLPAQLIRPTSDDSTSIGYIARDLLLYVAPIAGTLGGIIIGVYHRQRRPPPHHIASSIMTATDTLRLECPSCHQVWPLNCRCTPTTAPPCHRCGAPVDTFATRHLFAAAAGYCTNNCWLTPRRATDRGRQPTEVS